MNGKVILFLTLASCAFAAFVPSSEDVIEEVDSFLDFLAQDVIPTVKVDTIPTVRTNEVSFEVDEWNQEELNTEDDESNGFQCLMAHSKCYSSKECCSKRCSTRKHKCLN